MLGKLPITGKFAGSGTGFTLKRSFLLISLLVLASTALQAQNCTVNANVHQTICSNETLVLQGSKGGLFQGDGTTTWTQIGGPSVNIVSPNSLETEVTGIVGGNVYTFRINTTCLDGSVVFDDVTYTVKPVTIADAGPDQAMCPVLLPDFLPGMCRVQARAEHGQLQGQTMELPF